MEARWLGLLFFYMVAVALTQGQLIYSNVGDAPPGGYLALGARSPLADDLGFEFGSQIGALDIAYINDGDEPIDLTVSVYDRGLLEAPKLVNLLGKFTFTGLPAGGLGGSTQFVHLVFPSILDLTDGSNWIAFSFDHWGGSYIRVPVLGPPTLGDSADLIYVDDNADGNFDRDVNGTSLDWYSFYLNVYYTPEPGSAWLLLTAVAPLLHRRR